MRSKLTGGLNAGLTLYCLHSYKKCSSEAKRTYHVKPRLLPLFLPMPSSSKETSCLHESLFTQLRDTISMALKTYEPGTIEIEARLGRLLRDEQAGGTPVTLPLSVPTSFYTPIRFFKFSSSIDAKYFQTVLTNMRQMAKQSKLQTLCAYEKRPRSGLPSRSFVSSHKPRKNLPSIQDYESHTIDFVYDKGFRRRFDTSGNLLDEVTKTPVPCNRISSRMRLVTNRCDVNQRESNAPTGLLTVFPRSSYCIQYRVSYEKCYHGGGVGSPIPDSKASVSPRQCSPLYPSRTNESVLNERVKLGTDSSPNFPLLRMVRNKRRQSYRIGNFLTLDCTEIISWGYNANLYQYLTSQQVLDYLAEGKKERVTANGKISSALSQTSYEVELELCTTALRAELALPRTKENYFVSLLKSFIENAETIQHWLHKGPY